MGSGLSRSTISGYDPLRPTAARIRTPPGCRRASLSRELREVLLLRPDHLLRQPYRGGVVRDPAIEDHRLGLQLPVACHRRLDDGSDGPEPAQEDRRERRAQLSDRKGDQAPCGGHGGDLEHRIVG